jgi:hypothetical protein
MLAYVFWHWKRADADAGAYERALQAFHASLVAAPSAGLVSTACAALHGAPWANAGSNAYEDWYVVGSSADLDPLNEAAISAARQAPHDAAAALAVGGTAGLYRLRMGRPVADAAVATWFEKPAGWSYSQLVETLQPLVDGAGAALWGRQMTLGPAREFCLDSPTPLSLPAGLDALVLSRRRVFRQDA